MADLVAKGLDPGTKGKSPTKLDGSNATLRAEDNEAEGMVSFRKTWRGALRFMFQAQELLDDAAHPLEHEESNEEFSAGSSSALDSDATSIPKGNAFSRADQGSVQFAQESVAKLRMIISGQKEGPDADEGIIIASLAVAIDALSKCGFGEDMLKQLEPDKVSA